MKKSIFIKAVLIALMLSLPVHLFAYDRHVNLVKNGAFEVFPDVSIDDFFSTVFNDIGSWESIVANDGNRYVNASYVDDDYQTWTFQFLIYDGKTFELTYMGIDGEGSNDNEEIAALIHILVGLYYIM